MDRVDETTQRIQIRGGVQGLVQGILRGYAVHRHFTKQTLSSKQEVHTHIIKGPLDVRHNASIKGRELPPGRLTVRTDQRNRQSQSTNLPISL